MWVASGVQLVHFKYLNPVGCDTGSIRDASISSGSIGISLSFNIPVIFGRPIRHATDEKKEKNRKEKRRKDEKEKRKKRKKRKKIRKYNNLFLRSYYIA